MGKRILFFVSIFLVLVSCGNKNAGKNEKNLIKAPEIRGVNIVSSKVETIGGYRGKVILLNFWATWCPPCRAEIPDLIRLQDRYSNDLVIIGISVDKEGEDVVKRFYKERKMNYPVIMATGEILLSYGGISAIPTSYVIDREGNLIGRIVGYRNFAQYEEILKPYLGGVKKNESKN